MKNTKSKTRYLTELALMIALLFILGLTPLGYLPNPVGQAVTLLPTAVAVGAMMLGPLGGTILGTVMGLLTFYKGGVQTGFAVMTLLGYEGFTGIALTFINAVLPRLLMGLCVGWIYKMLCKVDKTKTLCCYAAGLSAPLLNTLFYMPVLIIIYLNAPALANLASPEVGLLTPELLDMLLNNVLKFAVALVGVQALVEWAVGCIIGGSVGKALRVALKR